ncbi:hypothetical protein TruAng_004703 [Truncatella angustata]|nr:hypothetical protein TruAng_004703 [Truncatella angustata]
MPNNSSHWQSSEAPKAHPDDMLAYVGSWTSDSYSAETYQKAAGHVTAARGHASSALASTHIAGSTVKNGQQGYHMTRWEEESGKEEPWRIINVVAETKRKAKDHGAMK